MRLSPLLGAAGAGAFLLPAGLAASPPPGPLFAERTAAWGLEFVHFNGMSGELYFVETMGAGAALVDYDGDGDLDAFLVQGAMLPPGTDPARATFPPHAASLPPTDRLFRCDLVPLADGRAEPRFRDVTARAGIADEAYGMGVTTGDVDGDGLADLYVTNFGSNRLWRNRGDGTFEDSTAGSGTDDRRWSVPATFFDADGDSDLDLFVGNYVAFSLEDPKRCFTPAGVAEYCGPLSFAPETARFLVNRGDGTFDDRSAASGIGRLAGPALGAVAADLDGDGRLDLYVANDQAPNYLWLNRGDGSFSEEALLAGCAVNGAGDPEASMGVDAGDYDGDGDEDLFLTHLTQETNTLYANEGGGFFRDATLGSGLGPPSWLATGFGTGWIDFDQDGWLDLVVVNGAVRHLEALRAEGDPYPLRQRRQIFRNRGDGTFVEATEEGGPAFAPAEVGRGLALGDLDNDGDTDLLVANNSGPARLLVNQAREAWLGLRLLGPPAAPGDALGAVAEVEVAAPPRLLRRVHTDGSYASASDPRLRFGLAARAAGAAVLVRWPDGARRRVLGLPPGTYVTLAQDGFGGGHP